MILQEPLQTPYEHYRQLNGLQGVSVVKGEKKLAAPKERLTWRRKRAKEELLTFGGLCDNNIFTFQVNTDVPKITTFLEHARICEPSDP